MRYRRPPQPWQSFLEGETDLGYFIRGHLAIHNHMSTLVTVRLSDNLVGPGLLELATFNPNQTYEIAVAIGALSSDLRPLIRRINAVRNRLAHQIGLDLDMETAISIFSQAPRVLQFDTDVASSSPKELVSAVFEFVLCVIDERIADTVARRERTRRKLQKTSPAADAAFKEYWKHETDPGNPEVLALKDRVYEAMSGMPFPLPRKLEYPVEEDDNENGETE